MRSSSSRVPLFARNGKEDNRGKDNDDNEDNGEETTINQRRQGMAMGGDQAPQTTRRTCRSCPWGARCTADSPPPLSSSPSSPDDDNNNDGTGRGGVIMQLSRRPDVFLIQDVLSSANALILMDGAAQQWMNVAGKRSMSGNDRGGIRAGLYLTWINPYDISGEGANVADPKDNNGTGRATAVGQRPQDNGRPPLP